MFTGESTLLQQRLLACPLGAPSPAATHVDADGAEVISEDLTEEDEGGEDGVAGQAPLVKEEEVNGGAPGALLRIVRRGDEGEGGSSRCHVEGGGQLPGPTGTEKKLLQCLPAS